jgi:hypothetical protein
VGVEARGLTFSALVASVAALVIGGIYWLVYRPLCEREVRGFVAEMFGGKSTLPCRIELRPASVWARQGEVEIGLDWTSLERIAETERGVEMWFRDGLVVARSRSFGSVEDQQRFA